MPKVRRWRNQLSRRPSLSHPVVFCNYTVAVGICKGYLGGSNSFWVLVLILRLRSGHGFELFACVAGDVGRPTARLRGLIRGIWLWMGGEEMDFGFDPDGSGFRCAGDCVRDRVRNDGEGSILSFTTQS